MKSLPFSIVSGVVTVVYSTVCFLYFSQSFWGFTALCVGALVTFYPLYFERYRIETIRDAQVAQYLHGVLPSGRSNSVYGSKLRGLRDTLEAIEGGRVHLTEEELNAFVLNRLAEKGAQGQPIRYWATHVVDSDRSLGVWGNPHSTYPYHRSYVERQRTLLDSNGEIVRLFIFDRAWLAANLQRCRSMIENHEALFDDARRPALTLALVPRQGEYLDRAQLSIIEGEEVFLWTRTDDPRSTGYSHGEYITNPDLVAELIGRWTRDRENAYSPDELFRLVEKEEGRL